MSTSATLSTPTLKYFFYEYGKIHYRETPSSTPKILNLTHQETEPSVISRLFSAAAYVEMHLPHPPDAHPKKLWVDVSKIIDFPHFKSLHPHKDNLEILKHCQIPETALISAGNSPISPFLSPFASPFPSPTPSPIPGSYVNLFKARSGSVAEEETTSTQSVSTQVEAIREEIKSSSHARVDEPRMSYGASGSIRLTSDMISPPAISVTPGPSSDISSSMPPPRAQGVEETRSSASTLSGSIHAITSSSISSASAPAKRVIDPGIVIPVYVSLAERLRAKKK